ncbi:ADP-sugar pyrophosphatase [Thraustotheca clavata]|uniref:ADP-sugar pyrophosphatase n=1 Tax=Thraustotheca clavata TaxID=74557 RepID=A0A1V9ZAY7_9STRA|nr:ADP-sugar pyrophosphatase [Thraustotheca clavata]
MNRLPRVICSKVLYETKWISLKELAYKDLKDVERSYITVERTTRRADLNLDAVIVLPLLKSTLETQAVLIRQFRPPLDNWTIELPAGLIDPNESIESTVAREIKEETGYTVSNIVSIGPTIANDQGLTNGNCRFVVAEVEKDSNGLALQELEETEMIEVLHVPISKLLETLHLREKEFGDSIDARLYSFALGQQFRI